ncbi:tyrosine-type recombinase/integrase, partial [Candidatus Gottesmanbacteria bacterium]|nr:tyrosine-type recombinase/integrase [Candidatus Gottesmanbacteria bacterium]
YKHEEVNNNPVTNVGSIKVSQKRPEYLSPEQYTNFLKTIEKESTPYYKKRDLMLVKILIMTGLRRAEVVGLNVGDVDLSKLRFSVKRKGGREEYVIVHNKLVEDLSNYLKIINRKSDEPLFMSKRGKRLSASSVWHLIKVYSKKSGLNGNVTVHSLRHTFATALLSQNVQLPYIQQLMGHRSAQTTMRYLHIQDNELSEAFNRVTFEERG